MFFPFFFPFPLLKVKLPLDETSLIARLNSQGETGTSQ